MKPIIVDTNILFAALRSKNESIREILENTDYKFLTPNYLIVEIFKHKERILKNAKGDEDETIEFLNSILHKIHFVSEELISIENFILAYHLCKNVDENDTPFVALALEFEALIWTKDNILKQGLIKNGFNLFFEIS
jgi:predicted nucleic acid-binding protein